MTIARAGAWLGAGVVAASLNARWGSERALGAGPPAHLERPVLGALLLALIVALTLSISGRRGPPGWLARGLLLAAGGGALSLALWVQRRGPVTALGGGWGWLIAGVVLGLAASTIAAVQGPPETPPTERRPARRRR
jgi:hypothetical protein